LDSAKKNRKVLKLKVNRRSLLKGAGAVAGSAILPSFAMTAGNDGFITLEARPGKASLRGARKPRTRIWSYNGTAPGPEIRVKQGEEVRVRLVNKLSQPTTIHWHGVRMINAMDGVPGLTQEAVPPGASFDYVFRAPDAGTFWYHSHSQTWEQVARGLYGVLIVDEIDAPAFDRDITLALDDWFLDSAGQIHEASLGELRYWSHGGRLGNWPTVNGQYKPEYPVKSGERVRLRLVNTCNARFLSLKLRNLDAAVIAIDGQPVTPYMTGDRSFLLAPAQRVDLAFNATLPSGSAAQIVEMSQDFPVTLASLKLTGTATVPVPSDRPFDPLPGNPLPEKLPMADALKVEMLMEGGAMGGMKGATYKGRVMSINDLVDAGKVWAFNGIVGMSDKPLFDAKRGRTVTIEFINRTAFAHPMHIHGHHFKVMSRDGKPVSGTPWRDTEVVRPDEKVSVAFVADNPGKWALHCHTLEHVAAGMITWFNVGA
jgi:FtsP/CotA-like multicopper oxidase with cupredoxin domain